MAEFTVRCIPQKMYGDAVALLVSFAAELVKNRCCGSA